MNAMPTAAAAGKIDVGGDLATSITAIGYWRARTSSASRTRWTASAGLRGRSPSSPAPAVACTRRYQRSALIEAAEEHEALIDQLEARLEELLRRLGQPIRTNGS